MMPEVVRLVLHKYGCIPVSITAARTQIHRGTQLAAGLV